VIPEDTPKIYVHASNFQQFAGKCKYNSTGLSARGTNPSQPPNADLKILEKDKIPSTAAGMSREFHKEVELHKGLVN
jgi:hypothetical protein